MLQVVANDNKRLQSEMTAGEATLQDIKIIRKSCNKVSINGTISVFFRINKNERNILYELKINKMKLF